MIWPAMSGNGPVIGTVPSIFTELAEKGGIADNPQGPDEGFEVYYNLEKKKSIRGGSFLCNDNWCSGYRNARRMRNTPDTSMEHIGFRCVRDITN